MNIIENAVILAIGTRLLRIHDQLKTDANTFYKAQGFDFETKWFPVIYVLSIQSPLSVMEIALEIGLSHPGTISVLKELENKQLIESIKDEKDERKRNLQLTAQGLVLVTALQPIWKVIQKVLTKLTHNQNQLFEAINEVEDRLRENSLLQRLEAAFNEQQKAKPDVVNAKKINSPEELAIAQAILATASSPLASYEPTDGYTYYMAYVNGLPAAAAISSLLNDQVNLDELVVLNTYRAMGTEDALLALIKAD